MNAKEKVAFRVEVEEKFKYSREIELAAVHDHDYQTAEGQQSIRSAYNSLLEQLHIEPIYLYPAKKDKPGMKIIAQVAGVNYVLMEDLVQHVADSHGQKGWEYSLYGKGVQGLEMLHEYYHSATFEPDHTHDRKIKVAGWKPEPGAH